MTAITHLGVPAGTQERTASKAPQGGSCTAPGGSAECFYKLSGGRFLWNTSNKRANGV
jgi:hypothetical protein